MIRFTVVICVLCATSAAAQAVRQHLHGVFNALGILVTDSPGLRGHGGSRSALSLLVRLITRRPPTFMRFPPCFSQLVE